MIEKITLACDIECYVNYFLVMFKRVDTGLTRKYEMFDGQQLDRVTVHNILHRYRIVTFNGKKYDMPMLALALHGVSCAALKEASDKIILGNLQPWQFEQLYGIKALPHVDHIDISEVAPGVMVSLKQYAGRMHMPRLQDLPIDPSAAITPDQRLELIDYCGNSDLPATIELWRRLTIGSDDVIGIRERIGAEVRLELRSKSDAQVAEAVIKATVEKATGTKISRPDIPTGTTYRYKQPAYVNFKTLELGDLLWAALSAEFVVGESGKVIEPPALKNRKVTIGNSKYAIGIGGLHSCEKSVAYLSDSEFILVDRDVNSFYPYLIKTCGLAPRNMGDLFLKIYSSWIDRRIAAKRSGDKTTAQTLKIFLNGLYGKLGSPYSIVYAPDLMIQVTLTGQLVLLMLIERIELAGISVVSANTDGIVIKCPRSRENELLGIVQAWERETGMETEETRYKALFSRDINNYVALKEKGGSKTKGVFSSPGLQKNVENEICNEAVTQFLEHGTPVAHTVYSCTDIRKFLTMRKVTGGGNYDGRYLGKVVRWYVGKDASKDIRRVKPNKLGNFDKVAGSGGAVPMMNLVSGIPAMLDHGAYITEANNILRDIGVTPEISEMLAAQYLNGDLFHG